MIEGESGILACLPSQMRQFYNSSLAEITFPNGSFIKGYSAQEGNRLRGPQHHFGWLDELASWEDTDTWDQFQLGLRLGTDPRAIVTTTPRPIKILRDLIADPHTYTTHGSSYDNRGNVADKWFETIIRKYEGTRLGRQELEGELLEDIPGALWTRAMIEAHRVEMNEVPEPQRIVVGVDPAVTNGEKSNRTGIVVVSMSYWRGTTHAFVLEDLSLRGSPGEWARVVVEAFRKWRADCVVAEVNQGGDLVVANIAGYDPRFYVPVRVVRATRGKALRAEPVARLYEQGRVHHVRQAKLEELEDELVSFVPGVDFELEDSPDRADACVHALTDLMINPEPTSGLIMGRA